MKITREAGRNLRPFSDIELGGVFEYDNVVYMKIELEYQTAANRAHNAVSLSMGLGAYITHDLCVLPLDCELVIR